MRKIKAKFYPEGINHHRWMLFSDDGKNLHWKFFYGTGSLYEQLCQWNAILRKAGYTRAEHPKEYAKVQSLYSAACDMVEGRDPLSAGGYLREFNTAMKPLRFDRGKWQDKLGEFLWKWRLIY